MRQARDLFTVVAWLLPVHLAVALAAWWMEKHYLLAAPKALWALATLPVLAVLYTWRRNKRRPRATLSTLSALHHGPLDLRARLRHLPFTLALLGLGGLLLALARPQSTDSWTNETREGIDIMIAMDVSGSMLARDLKPDRLEAARNVGIRFIDSRPNDRIGLVVYEGEAYTPCPLTTDHLVLEDLFRQVRSGIINGGTAVGLGLATAINRLRESDSKSRIIILLTDGVSREGNIQPLDAAQIAEQLGIRVYTIGVGTRGKAYSPVEIYPDGSFRYDFVPVEIDEQSLGKIAEMTGGKYFRATDEKALAHIYEEIDRLEKTRTKVTEHSRHKEEYAPFLIAGVGLLLLALLLDNSLLRTTP